MSIVLNIEEVEKVIGIEITDWVRECCQISALILKHELIEGKLIMGKYNGTVNVNSTFADYGIPSAPFMHCWIESNNLIIDATRWTLTSESPYIYINTKNNDYVDGDICTISEILT